MISLMHFEKKNKNKNDLIMNLLRKFFYKKKTKQFKTFLREISIKKSHKLLFKITIHINL